MRKMSRFFSGNGAHDGMKRDYSFLILISMAVIVLDQLSKFIVFRIIKVYEIIPVFNGFFNLVHIRNRGMAFGLMNRPDGDCVFISWWLRRSGQSCC